MATRSAAVKVPKIKRLPLKKPPALPKRRPAVKKKEAAPPGGFAPSIAAKLAKLGIHNRSDLVLHLPLRYEDETRITPIDGLADGVFAQVEGEVISAEIMYRPKRSLVCQLRDDSGVLYLRFLNFYGSQLKQLQAGRRLRVSAEPRSGFFGAEMIHPRYREVQAGDPLPASLTPVYPATAGLGQATLRKLTVNAIAEARRAGHLGETAPADAAARLHLPTFVQALDALHFPAPGAATAALAERSDPAWRRMKFDELLAQQLSLQRAYHARRVQGAPVLAGTAGAKGDSLLARFTHALPFALTRAQQRVALEIAADLESPHPMRRLLQGDVGSGKTVVAALAACRAIDAGYQAAFMAPTEILAEQHFRKLAQWLEPLGVRIAWLTGSLKKRDKEAGAAAIASGEAQLAIGTHALFQDKVSFARLGLAVIDEQHRFGVGQRLALTGKGAGAAPAGKGQRPDKDVRPHQLMMSATPIPRTLAMTYYADLDVSVIDELPPGRTPVVTKLIADTRRDEVITRIRDACEAGLQVYWVCPLIEESETLQLRTAEETYGRLQEMLQGLQVGLVHGRLKSDAKAEVMAQFAANRLQVLVATTVIEVGVDVPNASLMVVEHAERFGLSQLHQLRGRVGRGAAESACILLYQAPLGETARARLKVMFETTDGFAIAREDLRLRGPGEFLGRRQSGAAMLRFADLELDLDLVEAARDCAQAMLASGDPLADAHLQRWLGGREAFLGV
ncbi:MAG TPA: ATP-dependent DNA helicase RecG [Burkholderiales bacterium]|jgi:ATP-dependent DNA helicase RecG|nr:ATP-dependent DNA helicase RecG [Burkholderiales bacterium]